MRKSAGIQKPLTRGRLAPLWSVLPLAAIFLTIATLMAPITAVIALPVLLVLAVHHTIAIARTSGSPVAFMIMLALDFIMAIIIIGSLITR